MLLGVLQCTGQSPYNKGLSGPTYQKPHRGEALLEEPGKWKPNPATKPHFPRRGEVKEVARSGPPVAGWMGTRIPRSPGALLLVLGNPGNTWFLPPEERKPGGGGVGAGYFFQRLFQTRIDDICRDCRF